MPIYTDPNKAALLYEGAQAFMFQNEASLAGKASIGFQLHRQRGQAYPFGASFEISFSANPGAFQVDIQTADTDKEGYYVTIQSINGGLSASFVGRIELPNFWAKYVRSKVVTLTNAVNSTVMVTR